MRIRGSMLAALIGTVALMISPVFAQPGPVNVLQDCWTTDIDVPPGDIELELYTFSEADSIEFTWKHKILEPCLSRVAGIYIFECIRRQAASDGHGGRFYADPTRADRAHPRDSRAPVCVSHCAVYTAAGPV